MHARSLPRNEVYVYYNGGPLNLLDFTLVDAKVGKQTIKNSRTVITGEGKK